MTIGSNFDIGISVVLVVLSIIAFVMLALTSEALLAALWLVILTLNSYTLGIKVRARTRRDAI